MMEIILENQSNCLNDGGLGCVSEFHGIPSQNKLVRPYTASAGTGRKSKCCGIYELHSLISPMVQNSPLVGAQTVAPLVAKCNLYMSQH